MKKQVSLTVLTFLISTICFAQKKKSTVVPGIVKTSFQKKYPSVTSVKWDKEDANYEASFEIDKKENAVVFNSSGDIIETETAIDQSQLPAEAVQYINKHYAKEKIKETAKITDAHGIITYEAEIKGMDILFDHNGKFIKTVKD